MKKLLLGIMVIVGSLQAYYASAQSSTNYQLAVKIPGLDTNTKYLTEYFVNIYKFSLLAAGVIAFGLIVYHGFRYMTSMGDAGTTKDAFDGIQQALWGLLLLFSTYLILYLINPKLVDLKEPELPIPQVEIEEDISSSATPKAKPLETKKEVQRIEFLARNKESLTDEELKELRDFYDKYPFVVDEALRRAVLKYNE